jgi:hypothetical protein
MPKWKMLRYSFHKNDIPSYFKPTVVDKDFEDAVFSCIGAVPGQGVLYNRLNSESRTISADPMLIIRNDDNKDAAGLMLCTLVLKNISSRCSLQLAMIVRISRNSIECINRGQAPVVLIINRGQPRAVLFYYLIYFISIIYI